MSGTPGRSKYGAKRIEIDGERYDSHAEADDAATLEVLRRVGEIQAWRRAEPWCLSGCDKPKRSQRVEYVPDFEVWLAERRMVLVESKRGVQTAVSKLKHKLMAERYPDVPLVVVRKGESLRAKLLRLGEGS